MSKILVVEDDRNIAGALAVRLRAEGHEVMVAFDSISGINMARKNAPELVLLDISMPGGGGLLVAERLRNMIPTATLPIIFLTASKEPGLRDKAMTLGAVDFLEKPYEARELLDSIQRALADTPPSEKAA